MADPQTADEWLGLVQQHEVAARTMAGSKVAAAIGYWHAGTAVEYALKAYIMRQEGLNAWPPAFRTDVLTHDLRELMRIAGVAVPKRGPGRANWQVALQWQRNQSYEPGMMPRKVARGMVEAVFGVDGVVTWLRENMP